MVRIKGAYNVKVSPVEEYDVACSREDLAFAASLIPAYIGILDGVRKDVHYKVYYRSSFLNIEGILKGAENSEEIRLSYYSIVFVICMLRDDLTWQDKAPCSREKMRALADFLSGQIGYDYDAAQEKCRKKADKENKDDVGEEAMALMIKRSSRKE